MLFRSMADIAASIKQAVEQRKQANHRLFHDESLAEHGGSPGLRDNGLLESALARPQHLEIDGDPDLAALAAAYGVGLARDHPFVKGNKRAAFLAVCVFLALNGHRLAATQAEATLTMFGVASGHLDEVEFAAWLRAHLERR